MKPLAQGEADAWRKKHNMTVSPGSPEPIISFSSAAVGLIDSQVMDQIRIFA